MPSHSWNETCLYKALKAKPPHDMLFLLNRPEVMDNIELILDKGGTTPKDFTLHDADHSFRVAEQMWSIIPKHTQDHLSANELGLLLLSAYLHDIGMSPTFDRVARHQKFLNGDKSLLNGSEIRELQKWMDNDSRIGTIDIINQNITESQLLHYILSYYVRSKHNDWSGLWIEENLKNIPLKNYPHWTDDLIKICKSHHYGFNHLCDKQFDPKPVGGKPVHLRYLAMSLRIADVMENDPERTPEVILQHRDVEKGSVTYWLKDHFFQLTRNGNQFTIYARPERAFLHKAIEETATWIENELKLCDELIKVVPLHHSTFGNLDYYHWDIEPIVFKDIAPKDHAYVYIQGGFRPNTAKILELLAGNQLYGNPRWAFRELIQNSFDAIRERVGYQVVNTNYIDEASIKTLRNLYSLDISLEKRATHYWLVSKDMGVGMTKEIIENFFLESGSSKRHEIINLERRCREKSFYLGRTGQFGIGVLSYFMIADKIVIKTKRQSNTGYPDKDSIAWKFEINGLHDFGELAKCEDIFEGTEVELRLRNDVVNTNSLGHTIDYWDNLFIRFLKDTIKKSPCRISYHSLAGHIVELPCGWTNDKHDILERIISRVRDSTFELNSEEPFLPDEIRKEVTGKISFFVKEGNLPGLGTYRIHLPYFRLAKGNCFYFLKEVIHEDTHYILNFGKRTLFWIPEMNGFAFSLKGVHIKFDDSFMSFHLLTKSFDFYNAYIEVDIEHLTDLELSVSRHTVISKKEISNYAEQLNEIIKAMIADNRHMFNNVYGPLNFFQTGSKTEYDFWASPSDNKDLFKWSEIKYPVYATNQGDSTLVNSVFRAQSVTKLVRLRSVNRSSISHELDWLKGKRHDYIFVMTKQRLGKLSIGRNVIALVTAKTSSTPLNIETIKMPVAFNNILMVSGIHGYHVFNRNHKAFKAAEMLFGTEVSVDPVSPKYQRLVAGFGPEEIDHQEALKLTTPALCAFYLVKHVTTTSKPWVDLCANQPITLNKVFKLLELDFFFVLAQNKLIKIGNGLWELVSLSDYSSQFPDGLWIEKEHFIFDTDVDRGDKVKLDVVQVLDDE